MPGWGFIIFWIFLYFFRNFHARVEYKRNSGLKFCFLFFGRPRPVLAKNVASKRFYNFFTIFFGIFLLKSSMNGIRDKNFVFTFSAYLIPFWLKIMPGRGFIICWIFLLFFWNFLPRVECERNSGLKFFFFLFFSLPHQVLAKNNAGNRFYNFFTIFFGILLPGSSMNGIRD